MSLTPCNPRRLAHEKLTPPPASEDETSNGPGVAYWSPLRTGRGPDPGGVR
jgi:hypothetical protein